MSSEEFVRKSEILWADANSTTDEKCRNMPTSHTVTATHTEELLADEKINAFLLCCGSEKDTEGSSIL